MQNPWIKVDPEVPEIKEINVNIPTDESYLGQAVTIDWGTPPTVSCIITIDDGPSLAEGRIYDIKRAYMEGAITSYEAACLMLEEISPEKLSLYCDIIPRSITQEMFRRAAEQLRDCKVFTIGC
jgi:hypothetical protein